MPTLTRRRAAIELLIGYALILTVIWTPRPLQKILYYLTAATLLAIIIASFAGAKSLGLRAANLLRSSWIILVALILAAIAVLIAIRLGTLHTPPTLRLFFLTYIGYAIWSFVQQVLLLDFFLRRFQLLLPSKLAAVIITASVFAIAHLPNPILAPITLLWGLAATTLFLRYRNIIPLALAHAIFGITIAITVPGPVSHNMRVGLGYLHYFHDHPR